MKYNIFIVATLSIALQCCGQAKKETPSLIGTWENTKTELEDGGNRTSQGFTLPTGLKYEFKDGLAYDLSFGQLNSKKKYVVVGDTLKIGKSFITTILSLDQDNLILLDTNRFHGFIDGKRTKYFFERLK